MAELSIDILPDYNKWSKEDWINFHKTLKQHFWPDRSRANQLWSAAFNNKPMGWTRDQVYTADPEFKTYFASQGIKFSSTFYSKLDSVENFFTSLPGTVKKVGIGILIFGGAVILFVLGRAIYLAIKSGIALHRASNSLKKKIQDNPEILLKAL